MTDTPTQNEKQDYFARVIVLVYGMLEGGKPFWVYVAVKPSQYKTFQEAQKNGALNLREFDGYGEIIIAGEGQTPPVEVTLKICEVYQTDPKTFFTDQDPETEIAKKMQEIEEE